MFRYRPGGFACIPSPWIQDFCIALVLGGYVSDAAGQLLHG